MFPFTRSVHLRGYTSQPQQTATAQGLTPPPPPAPKASPVKKKAKRKTNKRKAA
ncbi:hypothetical protein P3G55_20755 [Leptospira sp. 96542]|nr:hypothetical protein [Leptospira sp. 96542]